MKALSADAIKQFQEQGYYAPVPALSGAEAAAVRRHLAWSRRTSSPPGWQFPKAAPRTAPCE